MMCQVMFISCNKCTIWVPSVDNGDNACVGTGGCENSLYFLLSFAVNGKLLLKLKLTNFLKEHKIKEIPFSKSHLMNTYKAA